MEKHGMVSPQTPQSKTAGGKVPKPNIPLTKKSAAFDQEHNLIVILEASDMDKLYSHEADTLIKEAKCEAGAPNGRIDAMSQQHYPVNVGRDEKDPLDRSKPTVFHRRVKIFPG